MQVKYSDLELAYYFVSSDSPGDNCALLDKLTGKIYFESKYSDVHEFTEQMWEAECSVEIPDKYDLDLGKQLVFDFVNTHLHLHYEYVRDIFSRRGAYSRYKGFLESIGQLQNWFEFEQKSTENALREWAGQNGVEIIDE